MAVKNDFSFCKNSHVTKIWKNHFPNGIFQWNLTQSLKVGKHEYIYIFEIKFEKKKYSV